MREVCTVPGSGGSTSCKGTGSGGAGRTVTCGTEPILSRRSRICSPPIRLLMKTTTVTAMATAPTVRKVCPGLARR